MVKELAVHAGMIRAGMIRELASFRASDRRVGTYYLNLDARRTGDSEATRLALENLLAHERHKIDEMDVSHAARQALKRDWELVAELATAVRGEGHDRALACFVATECGQSRALRLPWPVKDQTFFEDRFVLSPLRQLLDQSDHYCIVLLDHDNARLYQYFMDQVEGIAGFAGATPGRIPDPDPWAALESRHKPAETFAHRFERISGASLRQFQREPFEYLIIGGPRGILPRFEGHLHRDLRSRIIARWDIDVAHAAVSRVRDCARREEERVLEQQAGDVWRLIERAGPNRVALGPEDVFAALHEQRVQHLLVDPAAGHHAYCCGSCARLSLSDGRCVVCGGQKTDTADVYPTAVIGAIEQDVNVLYWVHPALRALDSMAAFLRF